MANNISFSYSAIITPSKNTQIYQPIRRESFSNHGKSHFLASAVLVEKQCLSGSSPRHTKMSQKGLNARRKQNCGGNPTQKLHHHLLVAQSQRVETHGTRSVKLWAAFHHKSYCFAPKCWSHTKQCCLHLCERQTDCSETVFLWVKSCEENSASVEWYTVLTTDRL